MFQRASNFFSSIGDWIANNSSIDWGATIVLLIAVAQYHLYRDEQKNQKEKNHKIVKEWIAVQATRVQAILTNDAENSKSIRDKFKQGLSSPENFELTRTEAILKIHEDLTRNQFNVDEIVENVDFDNFVDLIDDTTRRLLDAFFSDATVSKRSLLSITLLLANDFERYKNKEIDTEKLLTNTEIYLTAKYEWLKRLSDSLMKVYNSLRINQSPNILRDREKLLAICNSLRNDQNSDDNRTVSKYSNGNDIMKKIFKIVSDSINQNSEKKENDIDEQKTEPLSDFLERIGKLERSMD